MRRGTRSIWLAQNQGKHFCSCGCGAVIPLRVEHFNEGVPRFVHGHNRRGTGAVIESVTCACGCGAMAKPGNRFVNGHNSAGREMSAEACAKIAAAKVGPLNPMYGKRSPRFVGRTQHAKGYWQVTAEGHPFADSRGRVMEHRLVLEAHLRETDPTNSALVEINGERYLRPDLHVHHRDEDTANNAVENLVAVTPSEHRRLHAT